MKIKINNIARHQSHLISIHMQQQWWGSLVYKKKMRKKAQPNFWLITYYKKWRVFKVGIFLFLRVTFFGYNQHFFLIYRY